MNNKIKLRLMGVKYHISTTSYANIQKSGPYITFELVFRPKKPHTFINLTTICDIRQSNPRGLTGNDPTKKNIFFSKRCVVTLFHVFLILEKSSVENTLNKNYGECIFLFRPPTPTFTFFLLFRVHIYAADSLRVQRIRLFLTALSVFFYIYRMDFFVKDELRVPYTPACSTSLFFLYTYIGSGTG